MTGDATLMSTQPRVIVKPLMGGCRAVYIDDRRQGIAYSVDDVVEYIRTADLPDPGDVADPGAIEWRGGGPGVW